jgi:hypothetical protein
MHILIFCLQGDFEIQRAERIKACSTPQLLATGSLEEISPLALLQGVYGTVVKLRGSTIISTLTCLLAAYYIFNAEYRNGFGNVPRAYFAGKDWSNSANRC